MKKTRVNIDDVVCLAADLGIVKSETDNFGEEAYDELMEMILEDQEEFLVKYTQALLDHIEVGSSNLTGKEERYKGFGKRINENCVQLFIKTEC